jgi:transcriptional regulator with XRE-family HTH domain
LRSEKVAKAFGRTLRRYRDVAELSQSALAEKSDLDRTYISLLERGLRQPSLAALLALARAVNVSPLTMLKETIEELGSASR